MNDHIDPKRLFELAQLNYIFDEKEWPHIRHCDDCLAALAALVRENHQNKVVRQG